MYRTVYCCGHEVYGLQCTTTTPDCQTSNCALISIHLHRKYPLYLQVMQKQQKMWFGQFPQNGSCDKQGCDSSQCSDSSAPTSVTCWWLPRSISTAGERKAKVLSTLGASPLVQTRRLCLCSTFETAQVWKTKRENVTIS